jgi:hypothetical protein
MNQAGDDFISPLRTLTRESPIAGCSALAMDNLGYSFTVVGPKPRGERQKSELRLAQRLRANADGPEWKSLEAGCALQPR